MMKSATAPERRSSQEAEVKRGSEKAVTSVVTSLGVSEATCSDLALKWEEIVSSTCSHTFAGVPDSSSPVYALQHHSAQTSLAPSLMLPSTACMMDGSAA